MRTSIYTIVNQFVNIIFAFIAFFLGLRILFSFTGANTNTPFVRWIYMVSSNIMSPFAGIFPNQTVGQNAVLDITAIVALLAYAILFYFILAIISSLSTRYINTDIHEHRIIQR